MRIATLATVLLAGSVSCASPYDNPDLALGLSRPVSFRADNNECSTAFSCFNCTTAQVCRPNMDGTWSVVQQLACPDKAPYCSASSGTCSLTPDDDCGTKDAFICTDDGRFPDPLDCNKYHVCHELTSDTFECVQGYNYQPDKQRCDLDSDCRLPNCNGRSGTKAQFDESHYFAYCANGSPVMVARCLNNYKLNLTSQECDALCDHDGPQADNQDCTKFFMCSTLVVNPTLSVPIRDHLSCPPGQAFHPTHLMCVDVSKTSSVPPTTAPATITSTTTVPTTTTPLTSPSTSQSTNPPTYPSTSPSTSAYTSSSTSPSTVP